MTTTTKQPRKAADARPDDIDLDMPQIPIASPEVDAGLRKGAAVQTAVADASANVADMHLLRGIGPDQLPSESAIDSETARLQAEADVKTLVQDITGEALTINAEKSLGDETHAALDAANRVEEARARVTVHQDYLDGMTLDSDGTDWSDPVPTKDRRVRNGIHFWSMMVGVGLAESALAYMVWQYAGSTGDDFNSVASNVAAVVMSALALAGLPHLFVPWFNRPRRGGAGSPWNLLIALIPLTAVGLAVMRASYIVSQAPDSEMGWWLHFVMWLLMFLVPPTFVFIHGMATHNPHLGLYLDAVSELSEAEAALATAQTAQRSADARVKRTRAGRLAIKDIYQTYRDEVIPASGEAAKDEYRKELTRQLGDPEFTGALGSR